MFFTSVCKAAKTSTAIALITLAFSHSADALEVGETTDVEVFKGEIAMVKAESADRGERAVDGVTKVVMTLIDAIEKNDIKMMREIYKPDDKAMFYGAALAQKVRNTRDYVIAQNQCREMLSEVLIYPVDMQVQYLGNAAVATLTGVNETVTRAGDKAGSTWRWTLVMQDVGEGNWQVSHEHYSFESF